MDAKISPAFWDDLEEQPPEVKLTAVWAITNSSRDSCGVFRRSPARFAFQTGLEPRWLAETLARLPRMFIQDGDRILIKNFIRHQIGVGQALAKDNQAKGLHKGFKLLSPALQEAILGAYPELKPLLSPYQALSHTDKPLQTQADPRLSSPPSAPAKNPSPEQGLTKPYKKDRIDRLVQGECEGEPGAGDPTLQEVITRAGMIGMPEAEARKFYAHYAAKGWRTGGDKLTHWWKKLPVWKSNAEQYASDKKTPAASSAPGSLAAILAELEWQEDPARRAELTKKRRELEGAR